MNSVQLLGRLVETPELRTTTTGTPVTTFRLAVPRRRQKDKDEITDFFNIVCWRSRAEFASRHLQKGVRVAINGELQTRAWTDKQDNKRWTTEIIVDNIDFADRKPTSADSDAETEYTYTDVTPLLEDGDLPF